MIYIMIIFQINLNNKIIIFKISLIKRKSDNNCLCNQIFDKIIQLIINKKKLLKFLEEK